MTLGVLLPALTALLAFVFAAALFDQWLDRRRGFQLIWAVGMVVFGIASACEALGALSGWNELLYRTWYLTGAVWTAAWLGLGSAVLLGKTRFGYAYGALVILGGLIALAAGRAYPDAGFAPLLTVIGAGVIGLAIIVETYFQNERWPQIAALGVAVASVVATAVAYAFPLREALDPNMVVPTGVAIPGAERVVSAAMNVSGGLALALGALFSAYIFMPKKRVLDYSLDPNQPGDNLVFNLILGVVAIPVNFIASLPGAIAALVSGRIHSRVPATLLIAIGAIVASSTDALSRLGSTELFQIGKFVAVLLIFAGFLVSIEAFREIRIPFTGRVLRGGRHERVASAGSAAETR